MLIKITDKTYTCSTTQVHSHHHLNNQLHCVHTLCTAETNVLIWICSDLNNYSLNNYFINLINNLCKFRISKIEYIDGDMAGIMLILPRQNIRLQTLHIGSSSATVLPPRRHGGVTAEQGLLSRSCLQCQRSKIQNHVKTSVPAIPVPSRRFSHVHIDIVFRTFSITLLK